MRPILGSRGIFRFVSNLLEDPRDMTFVSLLVRQSLMVIPLGVALFVIDDPPWWLSVIYLALMVSTLDRFILMLHCTSHRRLFRRGWTALNGYVPRVLAPFFGQTPDTYFVHHVGMHHPENNLEDDVSSTMSYQRDSFIGFVEYLFRFLIIGMPDMTSYMLRKKRGRLLTRMLTGEIGWMIAAAILLAINWRATLVVFIIPLFAVRFLMMAGNWAQHAFIDAADPSSAYKNSITCINCRYNTRCFNDGYHIGHHLQPTMHYSEYPAEFETNIDRYAEEDAVVFEKIDFFVIWAFLMLKRYDWLAKYRVTLKGRERSQEETIAWLKTRTLPIPGAHRYRRSGPAPAVLPSA
jgi:fatty acid desaturase